MNYTNKFTSDLKKFGSNRALARFDHDNKIRDYVIRQKELAILGFGFLILYTIFGYIFMACFAVLIFTNAAQEARRMRGVGRYYQTKRSLEVLGV